MSRSSSLPRKFPATAKCPQPKPATRARARPKSPPMSIARTGTRSGVALERQSSPTDRSPSESCEQRFDLALRDHVRRVHAYNSQIKHARRSPRVPSSEGHRLQWAFGGRNTQRQKRLGKPFSGLGWPGVKRGFGSQIAQGLEQIRQAIFGEAGGRRLEVVAAALEVQR